MNQQSGMEADKEIDRFLQKVKKRDMRQKSILLLGMYALVGSILGFLVQCVAIWYPFYNCVPTSAAVFLGSIAVGGVHLFLCRTTTRRAARLADNMGMQERVSTSIEGRVTDHRIKFTSHRLGEILDGDINELLQNIIAADQTAKLAKLNEN